MVKSPYKFANEFFEAPDCTSSTTGEQWWRKMGMLKVPPKVRVFLWAIIEGGDCSTGELTKTPCANIRNMCYLWNIPCNNVACAHLLTTSSMGLEKHDVMVLASPLPRLVILGLRETKTAIWFRTFAGLFRDVRMGNVVNGVCLHACT